MCIYLLRMEKGEERLDKYLDRPNCLIVFFFFSKLHICNGNHVLSVKGGGELFRWTGSSISKSMFV